MGKKPAAATPGRAERLERETSMRSITPGRKILTVLTAGLLVMATGCSSTTDGEEGMDPTVGNESMAGPEGPMGQDAMGGQDASDLAAQAQAIQDKKATMAAHFVASAKKRADDGDLEGAYRDFAEALKHDPKNAEAQQGYQRIGALIGADVIAPAASDSWARIQARMQQAGVLVQNHMAKGHGFNEQGEYEKAAEEFRKAVEIRRMNPTADYEFDVARMEAAVADAEMKAKEARRALDRARIDEIERINREREAEERAKASRRVSRLLDEAVDAFEREDFADCEKLCEQVLHEDFANEDAAMLKETARKLRHHKANVKNISEYRYEWQRALDEVKSLGMPSTETVVFPSRRKWEEIANRGPISLGGGETEISEVDMEVRRALETTMLGSVDWEDRTLDEAIKFVGNNTQTNIHIMAAVDEEKPEEERVLSLVLEEVSAMTALMNAVESLELALLIEDGMVKITTKEKARSKKVVEFYEVRDLTSAIRSFPGTDFNLNPSGVGGGIDDLGFGGGFGDDEENISGLDADRLMDLIRSTVSPSSWDDDPANTMDNKNGTLVVTQTPQNHRLISQLLSDLRKSLGLQVKIEARFLTVENNFLQDIGVDIRGLGDNSGGVGTPGLGTAAPFDDFGVAGSASAAVIGTENSSGALYSLGSGNGDIRGRTQNLFDTQLGNSNTLTNSGGFALQWTYLDDTQLEAILRATQKYERVNTVTAPSLLVYNTQRSNLQISNQVTYVKDFDVEIAQAAVIADPVVDVIEEGVTLDVRPIVSNDRRFVTLELRPTVATLMRPIRTFSSSLAAGPAVTIEVPELRKESVKTTVIVPDGGTMLLGGLKFYEEQNVESGVPVLKDIPLLSFFFSRKGKYTNVKDLLILLRVKVIIMEELESSHTSAAR